MAKELQPVPGPTRPAVAIAGPSRRKSLQVPPPPPSISASGTPWFTVTDDVLEDLQSHLQRVIDERVRTWPKFRADYQDARSKQLADAFRELHYLHAELRLPTVPISNPHHFPLNLLADKADEERPGAHATYMKTLSRYISANTDGVTDDATEEDDSFIGLEGVEPEVGLLIWADQLKELVSEVTWLRLISVGSRARCADEPYSGTIRSNRAVVVAARD